MIEKKTEKRLFLLLAIAFSGYGLVLFLSYFIWYKGQSVSDFHFFNDWAEWHGLDKLGHFFTAFHVADIGVQALLLTGIPRKQAIGWGGFAGIFFQTPLEILDGFGSGYGFSWGDMIANCLGSLFLFFQYHYWNEIRIYPKFSFHYSSLASLRPSLLGENLPQQVIKDYNGQTYWFAIDWKKFIHADVLQKRIQSKKMIIRVVSKLLLFFIPAFGIGAENMIYARDEQNWSHGLIPYSQFYFSGDINFENFSVRQRFLQFLFFCLNKFHICLPALEYTALQGITGHLIYF
jgi:hypothetical protein